MLLFVDIRVAPLLILPAFALGTVLVMRERHSMLLFLLLGETLPFHFLVLGKSAPLLTDRLGKISLPVGLRAFCFSGVDFVAHITTEEDEGVLGPFDVPIVGFLRV